MRSGRADSDLALNQRRRTLLVVIDFLVDHLLGRPVADDVVVDATLPS